MGKHYVIHKTGSTKRIALSPEEDQATATGNMHRKFVEVWTCRFLATVCKTVISILSSPKGAQPQFSAHVCCGQTARWIKMPLGREVGLSPRHVVLDGDPAPLSENPKGAQPPIFGPCLLWPNGWMDQDTTWYGGRPTPWPHCVRWKHSSRSPKGT